MVSYATAKAQRHQKVPKWREQTADINHTRAWLEPAQCPSVREPWVGWLPSLGIERGGENGRVISAKP